VLPLVLFGPGLLLARALRIQLPLAPFTAPALWLGLSLSSLPVLYLWAWTLGIALTPLLLAGLCLALAAGVFAVCWSTPLPHIEDVERRAIWALIAVIALTMGTRFAQIRSLALPPWVDSVHHALLIRVAAETGTVPYSLRPYLPVDELPYHWGYHVVAAALLSLSGTELPQLMLWSGQVLNGLSVVAVAGLAALLWRSPYAGVGAALVTGLLSNMPAYYLSWGRYTQLTGLLVLPPLTMLALLIYRRQPQQHTWRVVAGLILLLSGLVLIHYRILIYWLPLGALLLILYQQTTPAAPRHTVAPALVLGGKQHPSHVGYPLWQAWGASLLTWLAVGGGAALLTSPWLLVLVRRVIADLVARPVGLVGSESYNSLNQALLWTGNNRYLFTLAALAALSALWRRRRAALLLVLWVTALILMANPRAIGLPPLWLLSNDSVLILLYLPTSLLLGGGLALLDERLVQARLGAGRRLLVVLLISLSLFGTWQLRDIVNATTVTAEADDLRAIEWAARETPADARFMVSAEPWLARVNRGGDGGWWLSPLAGRWVAVPPVLYTYGARPEIEATFARTSAIVALEASSVAEMRRLLRENNINYLYSSGRDGSFPPELLDQLDELELVHREGKVQIFRVGGS
jgi:hypothetical protein